MAELVRLKSGISTLIQRTSKRTTNCSLESSVSINPVVLSGLSLIVRLISAVKTEETES